MRKEVVVIFNEVYALWQMTHSASSLISRLCTGFVMKHQDFTMSHLTSLPTVQLQDGPRLPNPNVVYNIQKGRVTVWGGYKIGLGSLAIPKPKIVLFKTCLDFNCTTESQMVLQLEQTRRKLKTTTAGCVVSSMMLANQNISVLPTALGQNTLFIIFEQRKYIKTNRLKQSQQSIQLINNYFENKT